MEESTICRGFSLSYPGSPERTTLGEEDRFVATGGKVRHDGLGLSMDPVWADIDHSWVWQDGGSYYGVPVSNFFGWFFTVFFYQLFALYLRNRVTIRSRTSHWRLAILILCRMCSGKPPGCGSLVSGQRVRGCCRQTLGHPRHSWGISGLVSISLMMPLSADCLIRSLTR